MEKIFEERLEKFHTRLKVIEFVWSIKDEIANLTKNLNTLEMAILRSDGSAQNVEGRCDR